MKSEIIKALLFQIVLDETEGNVRECPLLSKSTVDLNTWLEVMLSNGKKARRKKVRFTGVASNSGEYYDIDQEMQFLSTKSPTPIASSLLYGKWWEQATLEKVKFQEENIEDLRSNKREALNQFLLLASIEYQEAMRAEKLLQYDQERISRRVKEELGRVSEVVGTRRFDFSKI